MNRRRTLIGGWLVLSALFIALILVRNVGSMRQDFERASVDLQFERTKEKVAPVNRLLFLTAVSVGAPLSVLIFGMALASAAERKPNE